MVQVTIIIRYDVLLVGPDPAAIDQKAFNEGHFDILELLGWVENHDDIKVTFENIQS